MFSACHVVLKYIYIYPFKNHLTLTPKFLLFLVAFSLIDFLGIHVLGNLATVVPWVADHVSKIRAASSSPVHTVPNLVLQGRGRNPCGFYLLFGV